MLYSRSVVKCSSLAFCAGIALKSHYCQGKSGKKTSFATFAANNPSEDRFVVSDAPENRWKIYGVFDGHGGWQVSEYASRNLVRFLTAQLEDNFTVATSLENTYAKIEETYIAKVIDSYELGFGEVGKVGSCAIVAVVNDNKLTVANSGDCRAVIGSVVEVQRGASISRDPTCDSDNTTLVQVGTETYSAYQVNRDHNARTALEQLLLREAHPDEDNIVKCKNSHACYVKGRLQLTRALGDAYLKYPEFNAPEGSHRSRGRHIPPPYTPPYVTTTPDIHEIELTAEDKFVIMATDGVWDFLTPGDAVKVVASCKDKNAHEAAGMVVEETLRRAAEIVSVEEGAVVTPADLKALPPGRSRRTKFDDTTVVVVYL